MSILRDILRRRLRSGLTITGIAVGMFALVVLGAVSENFNVYTEKATAYYRDKLVAVDEHDMSAFGTPNGNRPLTRETIAAIGREPGVAAALPMMAMLVDSKAIPMGAAPPMVISVAPGQEKYESWAVASGRYIGGDEHGVATVGQDLAKQQGLRVGSTLTLRGEQFRVEGILDRTYISLTDASAMVPLADAQDLYAASLPEDFRGTVKPSDLAIEGVVYLKPGADADKVAAAIGHDVSGVAVSSHASMKKSVGNILALFNTVLVSLSALGLMIGGMTIVNTMTMAVSERTREFGVRRALGASRLRIARDVLAESALLGGFGGLGGLALGALASAALGSAVTMSTGVNMFMLTWRLVVFAMAFAVFLGTLAGLYPALHAARMDPVVALAYE